MPRKKKPRKRKKPEPLPVKPKIDLWEQQKNLRTIRFLMGMNKRGLT